VTLILPYHCDSGWDHEHGSVLIVECNYVHEDYADYEGDAAALKGYLGISSAKGELPSFVLKYLN